MQRSDVLIVGAGVMGASTAFALSRAGRKVTLLEQFRLGHDRASSHGKSRIFRFSYPDTSYVEMGIESLALWRELEDEGGVHILEQAGGFDVGAGIEANAAALEACGARAEIMNGRQAAARWPLVRFPDGDPVLFSPDSGWTNAERAVRTFTDLARARGAGLIEDRRILEIAPSDEGVEVHSSDGSWSADVVVVTAGAWIRKLLGPLDIEVPVHVTRESPVFFRQAGHAPTLVEWGGQLLRYALPDPDHGLKAAEHMVGPIVDPDDDGGADPASVERVAQWVSERFPSADPAPVDAQTCFYTTTDDERFILERHGRVVVGSPCSGHGFKFAPLIGRRLAALAEEAL
jgi:monomeric sarcosine oxidase